MTALTGITDEMVAGHRFDEAAVNAFVEGAVISIAHNAGFDRKFAERYWPVFEGMAWGCSATEVDWRKHGFAGAQLGYLLNGAGYFHQAHRAVDDCHALLEILDFTLPTTGAPALAVLLETARKTTVRIWAEQSPFELKDSLKKRGYRWNDGSDGRPKSWHIDVCETALDDELAFLTDRDLPARRRAAAADADRLHPLLQPGSDAAAGLGDLGVQRPRRFSTFLRELPTFFTAFLTADGGAAGLLRLVGDFVLLPAGDARPVLLASSRGLLRCLFAMPRSSSMCSMIGATPQGFAGSGTIPPVPL